MVGEEQWAELRREHFVRGVSIKELSRRTGLSRNTIRAALRSCDPFVGDGLAAQAAMSSVTSSLLLMFFFCSAEAAKSAAMDFLLM